MPRAAPRPCTYPGCAGLAYRGSRCKSHPYDERNKGGYNAHKGNRHAQGYGYEWAKQRMRILRRDDHLCQVCGMAEATQVDHITPKAQLGSDDESNLMAVCVRCHRSKTARESQG